MSRIVTQDPLSRAPGSFSTGGGIAVPNMPAVNTSKAGAIASVLNSAAQALGMFAQVKVSRTESETAKDFETTKAQLIRHQQEAFRDPTREGVFLSSYGAAAEKFKGTRYEADIASFGEGTVTDFQQQAERRASLATQGFFTTRVMPAVQESLLDPEIQEQMLATADYTDRQAYVEGLIYSKMPEDMPSFMGPDGQAQLDLMVQESAARLNDKLQAGYEARVNEEQKRQTELAIRGSVSGLVSSAVPYSEFVRTMEGLKVPPTEYERTAATSLREAVQTAALSGDRQALHEALKASSGSLEAISDPSARRVTAEAIALASDAQGMLDMEAIGLVWSNTYTARGAEAAIQEVEQTARDLLSIEYGTLAYTVDDIRNLPVGGFRGPYLSSVVKAVESVAVPKDTATQLPVKIQTAISDFVSPSTAADGDPASLMKFTLAERTQFLGALASAVGDNDPEYTRLLAEAVTDPTKYAAVVADRFAGTRHAAGIVNYMLNPSNGYLNTDDGVGILFATLEQMGGLEAVNTFVDDKGTAAAIRRAFPQQPSAQAIREYKNAYDQIRVDIGEEAPVGLSSAIQSQKFVEAFFGTGGFFGGDESVGMDADTASRIAALVPLDSLPEGEFSTQKLADLVKTNMANAGVYLLKVPTGAPGTRSRMQLVHATTIPEVVGKSTQMVERGLNNPDSDAARYFGPNLGGTGPNIWDLAAERVVDSGRNEGFDVPTVKRRLMDLLDKKQAVIRVKSLQATQGGVPITLQMFEKGKEPAEILLGYYNFNDGFMQGVSTRFFTDEPATQRENIKQRANEAAKNPTLLNILGESMKASPLYPF